MILTVAEAARASAIVTADRDLLTLKNHNGILILSLTEFLDRARSREWER